MKKELSYTVLSMMILTSCNGENHGEIRSENVHMQPISVASHFVNEMYDVVKPLEVKKPVKKAEVKKDAKVEHEQVAHKIKKEKNNDRGYVETINAEVTAYFLSPEECGKSWGDPEFGLTASGRKAVVGRTIAMSRGYSFGTLVEINGKVYRCEDRGGAITGNKIDLLVSNAKEADEWGRRHLQVKILRIGDGKTYFDKNN